LIKRELREIFSDEKKLPHPDLPKERGVILMLFQQTIV